MFNSPIPHRSLAALALVICALWGIPLRVANAMDRAAEKKADRSRDTNKESDPSNDFDLGLCFRIAVQKDGIADKLDALIKTQRDEGPTGLEADAPMRWYPLDCAESAITIRAQALQHSENISLEDTLDASHDETVFSLLGNTPEQNAGVLHAIVVDGRVNSMPRIQAAIPTGDAIVTGQFSEKELSDLIKSLTIADDDVPE